MTQPDTTTAPDTSSEYIDDVKAYLEEEETTEQQEPEQDNIPEDIMQEEPEPSKPIDIPEPPKYQNISLKTDTSFIDDQLEAMSNLYQTTVKGFEYKITQDDKEDYLRCMLTDAPVILPVITKGSGIKVVCRALSVYEVELATYAGIQHVKNSQHPEMAELTWRSEVQKYRLSMQVMQLGKDKMDYLSFKPEIGKLQEHCDMLRKLATERFGNMSIIRWRLCIHALNIFEHKLTRLNELALMPDFLSPDE